MKEVEEARISRNSQKEAEKDRRNPKKPEKGVGESQGSTKKDKRKCRKAARGGRRSQRMGRGSERMAGGSNPPAPQTATDRGGRAVSSDVDELIDSLNGGL